MKLFLLFPFSMYKDNENWGLRLASSHVSSAKNNAVFAFLASGLTCPLKFEIFWKLRKLFTTLLTFLSIH